MDITSNNPFPKICEVCIHSKQHCDAFPKNATFRVNHILELIHSDVHSPLKVPTARGSRCWITFIDKKSHVMNLLSNGKYMEISRELELTEGTWLKLMCCAPSQSHCPKIWSNRVHRAIPGYTGEDGED